MIYYFTKLNQPVSRNNVSNLNIRCKKYKLTCRNKSKMNLILKISFNEHSISAEILNKVINTYWTVTMSYSTCFSDPSILF